MSEHPITPSPELVQQWLGEYFGCTVSGEVLDVELALATQAAKWGYEQGLKEGGRRMQKMLNEVANYVD